MSSSYNLWTKNFIGLFISQFLGAFNDNVFRLALLSLWAMSQEALPLRLEILTMLAGGLFILPFVLFAGVSGHFTDRFNRARLVQVVKCVECLVMALAMGVFLIGGAAESVYLMLIVLFLMGTQSAFFGPVKYAILPKMVAGGNLIRANALIEGSTFLAILVGMLTGSALIEGGAEGVIAMVLLGVAVFGLLTSLLIAPESFVIAANFAARGNSFLATFGQFFQKPSRIVLILSISWFWVVGSILLAQLPVLAHGLSDASGMITFFLGILIAGIMLGNGVVYVLASRYSANSLLSIGIFAYMTMGLFLGGFSIVIEGFSENSYATISDFLNSGLGIQFLITLLGLSCAAGVYSVPLYTALLNSSSEEERGKSFAINNFCNALAMVCGSVLVIGLLAFGDLDTVFMVLGILHFVLLPAVVLARGDEISRIVLRFLFRLLYRARVGGLAHYPVNADGLLIACNHVSYLDAPLLLAFLPKKPVFAIDKTVMQKWWVRMWLSACEVYPIDTQSPYALKSLVRLLSEGRHVAIFPEGMISHTGRLGKIYSGMGMAAYWTGKLILGAKISGLELSVFSKMERSPKRLFCRVRLDLVPAQHLSIPEYLTGRERKKFILDETTLMMREVMFQASPYRQHLYHQLLNTVRDFGLSRQVVDDALNPPMNYRKMLIGSQLLGQKLMRLASHGGGVGVLLPNAQAAVATFFALQAIDRVAVMLNFSAGAENVISAVQTSTIRAVVTSKKFIELAGLEDVIQELKAHTEIVYLEDLREEFTPLQKIATLLKVQFGMIKRPQASPDQTAVILFTSGSEGVPKGVALSHQNILSNVYQSLAAADFSTADRIFNPLPMFHCFGLTVGTLMPIFSGGRCFQFPTPLRHKQIVELIYQWKATVLFGANVFLKRYGEVASPLDLRSIRYVFAGAEKLQDETMDAWMQKFGIQILQGYGVTETSPILCVNTYAFNKAGTVGVPVPGVQCRLAPVEEFPDPDTGILQVRGPNVMQGYIYPDSPGHLQPPREGWHDTGDIVQIDQECFIRILGRKRRFAKIAGEMVSLEAVEKLVSLCWPKYSHAVLSRESSRRGEELVLFSENPDSNREELVACIKREGKSLLLLPSDIRHIREIPLLGTGKTDYVALKSRL